MDQKDQIYNKNGRKTHVNCLDVFNFFFENLVDDFVLIGIDELFFVNCWFCIYANAKLLYFRWEVNIFIYLLLSKILTKMWLFGAPTRSAQCRSSCSPGNARSWLVNMLRAFPGEQLVKHKNKINSWQLTIDKERIHQFESKEKHHWNSFENWNWKPRFCLN